MRYLYTGEQAGEIDFHAMHTVGMPGLVLMEKAAMTVAAVIMERECQESRILAVCGTGNNGGDGVAAARILHCQGYRTAVAVTGNPNRRTEEMRRQMVIAKNCGVPVLPISVVNDREFDIVLDGVFGMGLSRTVEGDYGQVLDAINGSGARIYALDIPSGIHAGSGAVLGTAVRADYTITFGVNKLGLVLYPGCEYAGEVLVRDIGFPKASVKAVPSEYYYYEPEDLAAQIPYRPAHSHKGTFGRVLVVAGSETMCGAACLAAKAAYAAGTGLVRVVSPACNRGILLSALPEALFSSWEELSSEGNLADMLSWADAIVAGPGLGLAENAQELVRQIIEKSSCPTVLDGDAIRICRDVADTLSDNFILTPHLKEMSILTGNSLSELQKNLTGAARETARRWHCIVAQKDARTVVTDGTECYINVSGNNGMATGGSGDVLAGLAGGLLGQRMEPFAAAKLAVYLHGLAGDIMAREKGTYSLLASDIVDGIGIWSAELYQNADRIVGGGGDERLCRKT